MINPIKLYTGYVFFLFSVSLSLIFPGMAYGIFNEEFNGNFSNPFIWQVNPNSGRVIFTENKMQLLRSDSRTTSFPYLYTTENIFSDFSDFNVEFSFRYINSGNFGDGIALSPNIPPYRTILEPNHRDYILFLVWSDPSGLNIYTTTCPVNDPGCPQILRRITSLGGNNFDEHRIKIEFTEIGEYKFFINDFDNPAYVSAADQVRPIGFWLGHSEETRTTDFWNSFELDYIRISELTPPAPLPEERDPVVIVPGYLASWDFDAILSGEPGDDWRIPSFVKNYENLIASLQNAGYVRGEDLFVFPYDWRKSLMELDDDLNDFVNGLPIDADKKIDFIGHSYGGLVSRAYAQEYGTDRVDQIVTVGSPHLGVADAYGIWEGAQFWQFPFLERAALELLIKANWNPGQQKIAVLRQFSPSVKELLPTNDFLLDSEYNLIPLSEMIHRNEILPGLNADISGIDALTDVLYGQGYSTLNQIQVEPRSWRSELMGLWEDGQPIDRLYSEDGDNRAMRESAIGPFSRQNSISSEHPLLVSDAAGIQKIFEKLGLDISNVITPTTVETQSRGLMVFLQSPGRIEVSDGDGNPLDPDDVIGVPENKLLLVPGAEDGDYQIEVLEEGEPGEYQLNIGYLREEDIDWETFRGYISEADIDLYPFSVIEGNIIFDTNSSGIDYEEQVREWLSQLRQVLGDDDRYLNRAEELINQALETEDTDEKLMKLRQARVWLHKIHQSEVADTSFNLLTLLDNWSMYLTIDASEMDEAQVERLGQGVERLEEITSGRINTVAGMRLLDRARELIELGWEQWDNGDNSKAYESFYAAWLYLIEAMRF